MPADRVALAAAAILMAAAETPRSGAARAGFS